MNYPLCGNCLAMLVSGVLLALSVGKKGTMMELDGKRRAYENLLKESVEKLMKELSPHVERISLFGSYPRRKPDLFTDLDILVVMKTEKSFIERSRDIYSLLSLPVDSDILCYTPEEFEVLRKRSFLAKALEKEVVLYEKGSA